MANASNPLNNQENDEDGHFHLKRPLGLQRVDLAWRHLPGLRAPRAQGDGDLEVGRPALPGAELGPLADEHRQHQQGAVRVEDGSLDARVAGAGGGDGMGSGQRPSLIA